MKTFDLESIVEKVVKKKYIHGFSIDVVQGDTHYETHQGNITESTRFFAASVTKLFVTTLILDLVDKEKLSLEDPITKYLHAILPKGFHTFKGKDYTDIITVKHLLSNTSGLPDYFDKTVMNDLLASKDEVWGLMPVINYVKHKEAKFIPGYKKKASYCDTNFQLLGAIIETVSNKTFNDYLKEKILTPLSLKQTYLYDGRVDTSLINIYYKDKEIVLPEYLASVGPEGGIVSTAKELNCFLKAFFEGKLFNKQHFSALYDWKLLFGPGVFFYGTGVSMQPVNLFKMKQGLIGHWGHSGAFAFYYPQKNIYMSGTVNQFVGHNKAAKVMLKVIKKLPQAA